MFSQQPGTPAGSEMAAGLLQAMHCSGSYTAQPCKAYRRAPSCAQMQSGQPNCKPTQISNRLAACAVATESQTTVSYDDDDFDWDLPLKDQPSEDDLAKMDQEAREFAERFASKDIADEESSEEPLELEEMPQGPQEADKPKSAKTRRRRGERRSGRPSTAGIPLQHLPKASCSDLQML